jgi:hypothetical protein
VSLLEEPVIFVVRRRTIRRSAKWNIDTARRWRRKRPGVTILEILSYLGAAALVLVVVWSIVVLVQGPGILKSLNDRCDRYSAACGTAVGFLIPLLSVALASAVFFFFRLWFVKFPVVKKAKSSPGELVDTAPRNIGDIVGRDELCQVIMEDVRHRDIRRPHLLVGGVGTGKTAVLVRLTELLAGHGAVPVPIRLRDAQDPDRLNFRDMASRRFQAMTEGRLLSQGETEKVWRQLNKDDKIVVLADGLEEALSEGSAVQDRDNLIRLAIHRACESGMPLIIASRPHEPLRGADATIMELEPLSAEAALEYIDRDSNSDDRRRLEWIVEAAGLTELPLYLQITRQLSLKDRLDYLSAGETATTVDTRSLDRDRSHLRRHLLNTWMEALFDGHLMPAVPLDHAEREAAVEWLSALACIGLKADTIDVKFEDYYATDDTATKPEASQRPRYKKIDSEIQHFLEKRLPRRRLDIRLAVTWGDQLGLVEAHGEGLRFPHSIMQAYLGSRFIRTALEDPDFREDAETRLQNPGREFLIALVLYSRSQVADQQEPAASERVAAGAGAGSPATSRGGSVPPGPLRRRRWGWRSTTVDTPAAATTATAAPPARSRVLPDGHVAGPPALSTGEAPAPVAPILGSGVGSIRDVLVRSAYETPNDVKKLYLYAAALEIDSLLDDSCHGSIAKSVGDDWADIRGGDPRTLDEAKLELVHRLGDAAQVIAGRRARDKHLPEPAYGELLRIGRREPSYPIRLAVAEEIGAGGDNAFAVLHKPAGQPPVDAWTKASWPARSAEKARNLSKDLGNQASAKPDRVDHPGNTDQPANEDKNRTLRGRTLCAWLAPQLAGSVNADAYRDGARRELRLWLDRVGHGDAGPGEDDFSVLLEVALAQGFKHAANHRQPRVLQEASFYLAEQAMEMLERARFWFSQLTLIHALCLWEMPEPAGQRHNGAVTRSNGRSSAGDRAHRHGSNPEATVGRWREMTGANKDHPFVAEACDLAVQALKTGRPQRFLWIDESGIVSNVGSRATQSASDRKPGNLWIPPSAGWAALDPRAQQLVADVLLVLNLAERGDEPWEIEQRLTRVDRSELPPCLTSDRAPLDPRRTVGGLYTAPGTHCVDGCPFRLCPYPPKGVQTYRSELSEAFCRGQQTLLSRGLTAPWQSILRADLKEFWADMADRARGSGADEDRD